MALLTTCLVASAARARAAAPPSPAPPQAPLPATVAPGAPGGSPPASTGAVTPTGPGAGGPAGLAGEPVGEASPGTLPAETFIALPPQPEGARRLRSKSLKMTVGVPPTTGDLGSEADSLDASASLGEGGRGGRLTDNWSFVLKGYLRAPMRLGYGPKDGTPPGAVDPPYELHSPARLVGMSSSNWAYINIAPNSTASLRATIQNARVAATLILTMNTFSDVGYSDLDSTGGIGQGYVTLKFPEAFNPFGWSGGLSVSVGAFSNRYGYAGPNQVNSGYYGTYLFGRTRVVGGTVTGDIDLTDHWELLFEYGAGAEIDILGKFGNPPKQMFIPGDPAAPLGSNFVQHAHVALWNDDWLKIAGHYLTSWTPNDNARTAVFGRIDDARLSSAGAEVHLDHPRWGHGFLGYSHVWGENLLVLNDALNVIHGGRGYDFKLQYFGNKLRQYGGSLYFPNDSGRVETVLFQYKTFSNSLLGRPRKGRGVSLSLFGMYSHAYSAPVKGVSISDNRNNGAVVQPPGASPAGISTDGTNTALSTFTIDDNKLKYGVDVAFAATRNLSFGFRFDRVQPTSLDPDQSYSAFTPYLWILPDWESTRKVIVSYTRFALGRDSFPDSPYSDPKYAYADPNLFIVSVLMSL
jgi:hypothetical protein